MAISETLPGIVVPDVFKEPEYVSKGLQEFKRRINEDYTKNKVINSALVRKSIEELIFNNKIKPSYPLNKNNVKNVFEEMFKAFGGNEFQWRYIMFTRAGFFLSTYAPSSFSWSSMSLPDIFKPKKQSIIDEYEKDKEHDPEKALIIADGRFNKLADEVLDYFRQHHDEYPIVDLIDSGAKGGSKDIRKLLVSIGLSISADGKVNDVIGKSHSEGLDQTQFFNYSSQAMVSQYQKSVETAVPGYLIRKLNTLMAGVTLTDTVDCGTKQYLKVKIQNEDMLKSLDGRLYKSNGGHTMLDSNDKSFVGKTIQLRSPLYCIEPNGICHSCYNPKFVQRMDIPNGGKIGLLASTSSANMLTSLTLKAAHTGLSLNTERIDLKKDIFEFSE